MCISLRTFTVVCELVEVNRARLCRKAVAKVALLTLGDALWWSLGRARKLLGRQGLKRYSFRVRELFLIDAPPLHDGVVSSGDQVHSDCMDWEEH